MSCVRAGFKGTMQWIYIGLLILIWQGRRGPQKLDADTTVSMVLRMVMMGFLLLSFRYRVDGILYSAEGWWGAISGVFP